MHTKVGPSKPHNGVVSGLPLRSLAQQGLPEKEQVGVTPRPSRDVFNQLGHNAGEYLRAHLDARRTLASSKKNDVPTFSPVHDEINELKKMLDKLAAKSFEATPSLTNSPFNLKI